MMFNNVHVIFFEKNSSYFAHSKILMNEVLFLYF